MALGTQELYGIYPAVFDSLTLVNVTAVDFQLGLQKMAVQPGGIVDLAAMLEVSKKPVMSITSHDIGAILTGVSGLVGLPVSTEWKAQWQQKANGGTFASGSSHVTAKGTTGWLCVDSIAAQQDAQKPADCMLKFYPLWDGTTVDGNGDPLPINVQVGQALAGFPAAGAVYKLGPVVYEGTALKGVQSAKVNFGLGYNTVTADGEMFPRIGTIDKRTPTIEIDINNFTLLNSAGFGLSQASTGIIVYFRRAGYSDSATQHVKIQIGKGAYEVGPGAGSEEKAVSTKLTFSGTSKLSGSAQVSSMVVTTGVALP